MDNEIEKKILRAGEKINDALRGILLVVTTTGLIIFIGLVIGLGMWQIVVISVAVIAAFAMVAAAFYLHALTEQKIKIRVTESKNRQTAIECENRQKEIDKLEAILRQSHQMLWEKLTFGEAVRSEDVRKFIEESDFVKTLTILRQISGAFVFEWFCRCAIEFYESKGWDILELKIIEFEQRLYIDDFAAEFYERYWTDYFAREMAKLNAVSSLQIAYFYTGRGMFYAGESAEAPGNQTSGEDQEIWLDVIEDYR